MIQSFEPARGLVPAREFIEIPEHSGMIDDIGRFALQSAVRSFDKICRAIGRSWKSFADWASSAPRNT